MKQNIFGGSLGGPIGKTRRADFSSLNYQGTRQRSGLVAGNVYQFTDSFASGRSVARKFNTLFNDTERRSDNANAGGLGLLQLRTVSFPSSRFSDPSVVAGIAPAVLYAGPPVISLAQ